MIYIEILFYINSIPFSSIDTIMLHLGSKHTMNNVILLYNYSALYFLDRIAKKRFFMSHHFSFNFALQ